LNQQKGKNFVGKGVCEVGKGKKKGHLFKGVG